MHKVFNPQAIEQKWYANWEQSESFSPRAADKAYCIMLPPPNVTGSLHMGHAFQDTLMDTLVRYHRMHGFSTLWQGGYDHAGIATQMVVERKLQEQGTSRHELGRDKFIEAVWQWKDASGIEIKQQLKRLGASIDWARERFTLDEGLSSAVQKTFIQLYKEGLIYRGKRLVNWDTVFQSAISDVEVESGEEDGYLWHINYPIADSSEFITIATTRPETMLGDSAVAVHPDDKHYQHLIGSQVQLPLTGRKIPIIADSYVDPEFGSGCVKITPAHDFNDYEIGLRHNLEFINILTPDGKITSDAMPPKYVGLDRFTARKQIVADLEEIGLMAKIVAHKLMVPRGDRSKSIIEPYLTNQWFVKVDTLAQAALNVVEDGTIKFVPQNWEKTYFEWMRNIKDWCISRQLWWGHRIPAWYDSAGNIYVGSDADKVRQEYDLAADTTLTQDEDVLDTWFSSALWPFSTLGWPQQTPELETFYPTNVLVTGFDIIFFWVARMIMFGLKLTGQAPFKKVYIHGLIQDQDGRKMSKTYGNVIDPIDLIEGITIENLVAKRTAGLMQPHLREKIAKRTYQEYPDGINSYGADALRFNFLSIATHGRHIRFDVKRLEGYRNFCNKIWNAARFILMNLEQHEQFALKAIEDLNLINAYDEWIISRWQQVKTEIARHFSNYRFDLASTVIFEFVWHEFCDWYLEFSKVSLQAGPAQAESCKHSLIYILTELLHALHPMIPFITEEIWQNVAKHVSDNASGSYLINAKYPTTNSALIKVSTEQQISWLQDIIDAVRNLKGESNIAPSKELTININCTNAAEQAMFNNFAPALRHLVKIKHINFTETAQEGPVATKVVKGLTLSIALKGLVNVELEQQRLNKEIVKLKKELLKISSKLENSAYLNKAPQQVVDKERAKAAELQNSLKKLEFSLDELTRI